MSNDHHDHGHAYADGAVHAPPRPDLDDTLSYWQALEIAVRELLIEHGHVTADEVRRQVEDMDARTPARGAQVVARAWVDPAYKARLLRDGSSAIAELGLDRGPYELVVVENDATTHNVVVCTLCSC
jgi:nitrile hydratase